MPSFAQWTNIGPGGQSLSSISFYDANLGFACGAAGSLFRTANGGTTWTLLPNFNTPGMLNRLRSVAMSTRTTVLVIWETPNQTQPTGSFYSSNSGNVFGVQNYGTFNAMSFRIRVPGIGLQVGDGGTLRYSTSDGGQWASVASGTQQNLRDCDCPTLGDCFVAGDNGTVRKNVSGDLTTWRALNSTTSARLNGIYFDSPTRGYIVGNGGTALRTVDGGVTWIPINLGTSVNLNDVNFLDSDTGFIVGDVGTIFATTDRGVTWQAEPSNTFENLYAISSVGYPAIGNTTWIAGEGGTVLKRTPVVLSNRNATTTDWKIYPNPFSKTLTLDVPDTGSKSIEATLTDVVGRQVFAQNISEFAGRKAYELVLPAGVEGGVYWLEIKTNEQVIMTKRVVKVAL